jgi:hypothetical protein
VRAAEAELREAFRDTHADVAERIVAGEKLSDDDLAALRGTIDEAVDKHRKRDDEETDQPEPEKDDPARDEDVQEPAEEGRPAEAGRKEEAEEPVNGQPAREAK